MSGNAGDAGEVEKRGVKRSWEEASGDAAAAPEAAFDGDLSRYASMDDGMDVDEDDDVPVSSAFSKMAERAKSEKMLKGRKSTAAAAASATVKSEVKVEAAPEVKVKIEPGLEEAAAAAAAAAAATTGGAPRKAYKSILQSSLQTPAVKREKKTVRFIEADSFTAVQDRLDRERKQNFEALGGMTSSGVYAPTADELDAEERWGPGRGEGLHEKKPHIAECFTRVKADVWDTGAWHMVLEDLKGDYALQQPPVPLKECEDVYRRYLHYFPAAHETIRDYLRAIDQDERLDQDERTTKIDEVLLEKLTRGVNQHVETWRLYTTYVMDKGDYADTCKAFLLAIDRAGLDCESKSLWDDYLEFLFKRGGEFRVQSEIRDVYHKMLNTPLVGMDGDPDVWRQYLSWEKRLGPRRVPDSVKTSFDRAADHVKTLRFYTEHLDTSTPARPLSLENLSANTAPLPQVAGASPSPPPSSSPSPSPTPDMGGGRGGSGGGGGGSQGVGTARAACKDLLGTEVPEDYVQVALWLRLIDFEAADPMHLALVDKDLLYKRIETTCKKALVSMARVPCFWYVLARFYMDSERHDEAHDTFSEGIASCPDSLILRFAYADMLRRLQPNRLLRTTVKREGDNAVRTAWQSPSQIMVIQRRDAGAKESGRYEKFTPFTLGRALFEDTLARVEVPDDENKEAVMKLRTVTWIQFVRFLKSASHSDEEQRLYEQVYLPKAHSDPATLSGAFYSAVAQLERMPVTAKKEGSTGDPRAVLDKGWQRQRQEGAITASFVREYMTVLWHAGDEHGLRMLFSQLFETNTKWQEYNETNEVMEVFNKYVEIEMWRGELHTAELRREERFGKNRVGTQAAQLLQRYSYYNLHPCPAHTITSTAMIDTAYAKLMQLDTHRQEAEGGGGGVGDGFTPQMKAFDPLQDNLPPHKTPSKRRVQMPDVNTKWRQYTIPMNRTRWTADDDQNSDYANPRGPPVNVGVWAPHKRPTLEAQEEDRTKDMPSLVGMLSGFLQGDFFKKKKHFVQY